MLSTRLCDLLGIDYPILSAPMGPDLSGPELVAAVSDAGGLGILQAQLAPPVHFRHQIRRVRQLTEKPFGANFVLALPHEDNLAVCLEERVPVLSLFWGDPTPYVELAHQAGVKVIHQVGVVEAAQQAARAGVDAIVAQGVEAGGHLGGRVSTLVLVPRVADAVAPLPVIAAGGIADARGLVAALALGAEGVVLGTRFLATVESRAHPFYKERLLAAREDETVVTTLFGRDWPHAPHRVLRTAFVEQWLSQETRAQECRSDEPVIGATQIAGQTVSLQRFMSLPPNVDTTGQVEAMALLAGQSVGLIERIRPAGEIVRELVHGARRIIDQRIVACLEHAPA